MCETKGIRLSMLQFRKDFMSILAEAGEKCGVGVVS